MGKIKSRRNEVADSIHSKLVAARGGAGSSPGLVDPAAPVEPAPRPGATFTAADIEARVAAELAERRVIRSVAARRGKADGNGGS
jgi:hypothetical protein